VFGDAEYAGSINCAIDEATDRITAYRFVRLIEQGELRVPIKWNITGKAMKARGIMDQISAEYDGLITDGSEHLADVKGIHAQVGEMKDDLYSAANVMGNSGGGSNASDKAQEPPPGEKQTITAKDVGDVADILNAEPPAAPSPPAVGQTNPNFHE
jgi:hypothetical protein